MKPCCELVNDNKVIARTLKIGPHILFNCYVRLKRTTASTGHTFIDGMESIPYFCPHLSFTWKSSYHWSWEQSSRNENGVLPPLELSLKTLYENTDPSKWGYRPTFNRPVSWYMSQLKQCISQQRRFDVCTCYTVPSTRRGPANRSIPAFIGTPNKSLFPSMVAVGSVCPVRSPYGKTLE